MGNIKKKKSPWRWPLMIAVIGGILYFSRSFWPLFFQGEPYAEIEATIPADMTLRVGATYSSSSCTEMTFSDFSQIRGRKGWSKEYTPDNEGRITAKIYQFAIGPCDWFLNGFSISTVYHKIPANVLALTTMSDGIKKEMNKIFSDVRDISHRTARLNLNFEEFSSEGSHTDNVTLNTILTPIIIKRTVNNGGFYYKFSYDDVKRIPNSLYEIENINPYGRKESLKIRYHVEVDDRIIFEEVFPDSRKNTSEVIQ